MKKNSTPLRVQPRGLRMWPNEVNPDPHTYRNLVNMVIQPDLMVVKFGGTYQVGTSAISGTPLISSAHWFSPSSGSQWLVCGGNDKKLYYWLVGNDTNFTQLSDTVNAANP